ncbi:MAG: efflux RND transporter permease subunit [Bacteroidia bacterium]|nr:efflux RND transporter permease subunit [Bacteroidia bacterium]
MRLPKLAIDNYAFVLILVLMAASVGVLSFLNMPRYEDPSLKFPFFNVIAVYPGTNPQDMEELVVNPLEEQLNEMEDLTELKSEIRDGLAIISVEGSFDSDVDDLLDKVNEKVAAAREELPEDLFLLEVRQVTPLDVNVLQLALLSETAPYSEMLDWAERLEDRLEKVGGVRTVDIEAYPEEEVRLALDMDKMARYGISLRQLSGIIQANNTNIPGGDIDAGALHFSLKTSGGYKSLEELKNTVISSYQGRILYLKDIADINFAYEDPKYLGRLNGQRAIFISATQKEGKNILKVGDELEKEVMAFQEKLPAGLALETAFEQAPAVKARVNDFFVNLLQGIGLVGLIIFMFFGFRNSLIIMTVIPTSIVMSIWMLDSSGFGLQQMSIAGLVIALGLLVDNGIVVVENINRYLKEGHSLKEAAVEGTREVGWAIVSSTATSVLAFFPLTQLGGGVGDFIKSMPITVVYALIASLLLALTLTPLLGSKWLKEESAKQKGRLESYMQSFIENYYRRMLRFSLKRPFVVLAIGIGTLLGSVALFPLVGISFFPGADKPILVVDIDLPDGKNIEKTDETARYVESVLDTTDFVSGYISNVGHGNPRMYYNVIPKNFTQHHAQIIVHLEEWDRKRFYQTFDKLRGEFSSYPGAKIKISELQNGPPYDAPIAIQILGEDLDTIKTYADQLEDLIDRTPGTLNVNNPLAVNRMNIRTRIKRDKAGMFGVQFADIDLSVRTALNGNSLGKMNYPDGSEYDIVARMKEGKDAGVSDFHKISVASVTGSQIPLRQVADIVFEPSASQIDHRELQRNTTITADVEPDANSREITLEIIGQLDDIKLPEGYEFYISGEFETQQESFGDLGVMLIAAVLGIFAILVLQFKSFSQPFVVLSAIPLAFSGSIVGLFLAGYSFSFLAFVGFTSLVGIVVNTSIILVDYSNQLRDKGMEKLAAIQKASETRFTPILLTSMTTILGLLPLTLSGSSLWSPLGWTIIGGMVSSTLLTLLVVPILYKWFT